MADSPGRWVMKPATAWVTPVGGWTCKNNKVCKLQHPANLKKRPSLLPLGLVDAYSPLCTRRCLPLCLPNLPSLLLWAGRGCSGVGTTEVTSASPCKHVVSGPQLVAFAECKP